MIAVDTNILVYAHRADSEWHAEASEELVKLAEGSRSWGIPWPCVHEFIAVVTHPNIYSPPTPLSIAFDSIQGWVDAPGCRLLGEGPGYLERLRSLAVQGKSTGPRIHDARIAAICYHNGVSELWTADRDFSRFSKLKTTNPMAKKR